MPPQEGRIPLCRSLQDLEAGASVPLIGDGQNVALTEDASGDDIENNSMANRCKNEEEDDEDDSVLAFYEAFRVPPIMRHLSMSDGDSVGSINESSPLLNPLKSLPRGTPKIFWFHRAWRWYNQLLERRPVLTKAVTAGIIVAMGDVTGQWMDRAATAVAAAASGGPVPHEAYDAVRTIRFCAMGVFLQAPVTHYYYHALDEHLPPTPYPWTWTTLLKLVIDQSVYAPTFLLAVFLFLGIFEGASFHEIGEQLHEDYWSTMKANWKLWIPATLLNLAYVAPQYRVLYCNLIFFVWSIFLSLTLNETPDPDASCLGGC